MNIFKRFLTYYLSLTGKFFFSVIVILLLTSCQTDDDDNTAELAAAAIFLSSSSSYNTGALYDPDSWNSVPRNVSGTALSSSVSFAKDATARSTMDIPTEYMIPSEYLPTPQNQQKNDCAAWAIGYGAMSIMQAVKMNETIDSYDELFSPKHLFWTVPDGDYKGTPCDGLYPEAAWATILANGIAPLSSVPYQNLGTCAYNEEFTNTHLDTASNYKIESYRVIEVNPNEEGGSAEEVEKNIKEQVAKNIPVVIGARLGDNFQSIRGQTLYSSDTYKDPNFAHALHAMVVVGYTDEYYVVLNSWGTGWGDNGFGYIDKNWFHTYPFDENGNNLDTGGFLYQASVAKMIPDKTIINSEKDMMATYTSFDCNSSSGFDCEWFWGVGNYGEKSISVTDGSDAKWYLALIAYNAFNANDIQLLAYEVFHKDGTNAGYQDTNGVVYGDWALDFPKEAEMVRESDNPSYFDIPSSLNGSYYFTLVVDVYDTISENREDNNTVWSTEEPISFVNGTYTGDVGSYSRNLASPAGNSRIGIQELKKVNRNTYSTNELYLALQNEKNKSKTRTRSVLSELKGTKKDKALNIPKFK